MRRFLCYTLTVLFALSACRTNPAEKSSSGALTTEESPMVASPSMTRYAEKFSIGKRGDYSLISVHAPWQRASETTFSYLTGKSSADVPDSLSGYRFIRTPVERAVIMSTTFISFLDTLGALQTVQGISGGSDIYHPGLKKWFESGGIREVGFDQSLNYEVLVDLQPDVVFMFGVQSGILQTINKLAEIGITVVICADYLEPHPLGRSEWLKFFAQFYEKEQLADSIFNGIVARYNTLTRETAAQSVDPRVLLGLPWKDAWYVAGGKSFAAKLISDAGGSYIFEDENHAEARPMGIERVFMRGLDADIWINPGVASSLDVILDHDRRFESLHAFQKRQVFNNTKRTNGKGGNDYWETGVLRPDLVLKDLAAIFRDPQVNNSELYYYERLK